jgi:hypothetical protein
MYKKVRLNGFKYWQTPTGYAQAIVINGRLVQASEAGQVDTNDTPTEPTAAEWAMMMDIKEIVKCKNTN